MDMLLSNFRMMSILHFRYYISPFYHDLWHRSVLSGLKIHKQGKKETSIGRISIRNYRFFSCGKTCGPGAFLLLTLYYFTHENLSFYQGLVID